MGVSWPRQPWSNFGLHNTHGFPTRKVFYGYLSRVNVCKPTFWRSLLSQHAYSGFSGFRIAAINLFQVDLDKPLNYLWYCYEKQWCWRWECKQWCWRSHQKRSSWSLWEKICGKNCPKSFSGKFGEIRAKILRTLKNLPAPTPMMKRHLSLHCPSFERSEGEMPPAMPPFSGVPVHSILHSLYLLL